MKISRVPAAVAPAAIPKELAVAEDATEPESDAAAIETEAAVPTESAGAEVEEAIQPAIPQEMKAVEFNDVPVEGNLATGTGDWRVGEYHVVWNGTELSAKPEQGGDKLGMAQIIKLPSTNPNQDAAGIIILVPIKPKPDAPKAEDNPGSDNPGNPGHAVPGGVPSPSLDEPGENVQLPDVAARHTDPVIGDAEGWDTGFRFVDESGQPRPVIAREGETRGDAIKRVVEGAGMSMSQLK